MSGWWQLIRERFPLGAYLPMVALFVAGNGGAALVALGGETDPARLCLAGALSLSFFFRLRCFDEIKDYATDCEINPTRPLPRGAVTVAGVKRMIAALTGFELIVAAGVGTAALATHALAVAYSFLMYREFFIGRLLRPHLTTYAVTHTFVSILLGYSVAAIVANAPLWRFPRALLAFGAVNWALFNLFEFARKTYAPSEERLHVDSYSRLFRPLGAAALSLSQVGAALALIAYLTPALFEPSDVLWHLAPAAALAGVAAAYAARARARPAGLLRATAGLYIVTFYALMTAQLFE